MEFSELNERYSPLLRQYAIPLALGIFGLIFLGYGLISSNAHKQDSQDILAEGATDEISAVRTSKVPEPDMAIDIEGAVLKPGVYKLPKGSRVQDVLIAAGGLSDKADRGKVSKGLNLASKVVDGGKFYIPFDGESVQIASLAQGSTGETGQAVMGDSTTGIININTASAVELDSLPGIGMVTAAKIINGRPYGDVQELLTKKVVSQSVFGKIKEKITAN